MRVPIAAQPPKEHMSLETLDLKSWEDFPDAIAEIRKSHGTQTISPKDGNDYTRTHRVLFRGQSHFDWDLATTLERKAKDQFSIERYLADATHCVNEIESLTGKRWDIPDLRTLIGEITDTQDSMRVYLPSYAYLVYLRHHGFPSPVLDWTESTYIAAYFASCDNANADRIASQCTLTSRRQPGERPRREDTR